MSDADDPIREIVRREVLPVDPAQALAGILDIDIPNDDTLPPLWHWVYFLERPRQNTLGSDGHPTSGIPAPPEPGCQRMFAGGRLRSHGALRLGQEAARITRVAKTQEKTGRAGPLTFVTVQSEISQEGRIIIEEEKDIVYRSPESRLPGSAESQAFSPERREPSLGLEVDSTLLFRFSAVTYNAHRIHYDHEYVRLEGYDDLVVHGPLQVLMMGELLRRNGVSVTGREYAYRLMRPMIGPQRMTTQAAADGVESGAETLDASGMLTAVATLGQMLPR